jgi:DNA-binding CsgD family transcriptional regulator
VFVILVSLRRSAYLRGVTKLYRTELESVLGFLADVASLDFDELYPLDLLARLQALVPCDAVTYQDADLRARRFRAMVGIGPDDEDEDDADDEALYWSVAPCPISDYRARTGDLSAIRMSDLISQRRYHELPIFREYFHSSRLNHMIDLGLPAGPQRHRSFILFRRDGASDFTNRDRAVLDVLRPHLRSLEARAALRRRLMDSAGPSGTDGNSGAYTELTPREREIVWLVAEGKTNAEIAVELWVAPSTVKKHLEHVYEKLGVGRRTAAATLARAIH